MDFDRWLNANTREIAQKSVQETSSYWLKCGCGKEESVSDHDLLNGNVSWHSDDPESGIGLCGSGPRCIP